MRNATGYVAIKCHAHVTIRTGIRVRTRLCERVAACVIFVQRYTSNPMQTLYKCLPAHVTRARERLSARVRIHSHTPLPYGGALRHCRIIEQKYGAKL